MFVATSSSPNISGGSSPSREVQEILSVKEDSDNILNDEFYDDNNDLLDENDADSVEKVEEPEPYYNKVKGEFKLSGLRMNGNKRATKIDFGFCSNCKSSLEVIKIIFLSP